MRLSLWGLVALFPLFSHGSLVHTPSSFAYFHDSCKDDAPRLSDCRKDGLSCVSVSGEPVSHSSSLSYCASGSSSNSVSLSAQLLNLPQSPSRRPFCIFSHPSNQPLPLLVVLADGPTVSPDLLRSLQTACTHHIVSPFDAAGCHLVVLHPRWLAASSSLYSFSSLPNASAVVAQPAWDVQHTSQGVAVSEDAKYVSAAVGAAVETLGLSVVDTGAVHIVGVGFVASAMAHLVASAYARPASRATRAPPPLVTVGGREKVYFASLTMLGGGLGASDKACGLSPDGVATAIAVGGADGTYDSAPRELHHIGVSLVSGGCREAAAFAKGRSHFHSDLRAASRVTRSTLAVVDTYGEVFGGSDALCEGSSDSDLVGLGEWRVPSIVPGALAALLRTTTARPDCPCESETLSSMSRSATTSFKRKGGAPSLPATVHESVFGEVVVTPQDEAHVHAASASFHRQRAGHRSGSAVSVAVPSVARAVVSKKVVRGHLVGGREGSGVEWTSATAAAFDAQRGPKPLPAAAAAALKVGSGVVCVQESESDVSHTITCTCGCARGVSVAP